jgi:hypothetical protein
MDELVQRLSEGRHPIELSLRPERTTKVLKECLDRGYVHVKFTGTQGGTELGVPVDRERSALASADLESGAGRIRIVGALNLNFVDVRCVADVDLASLSGEGHLEILDAPTA